MSTFEERLRARVENLIAETMDDCASEVRKAITPKAILVEPTFEDRAYYLDESCGLLLRYWADEDGFEFFQPSSGVQPRGEFSHRCCLARLQPDHSSSST